MRSTRPARSTIPALVAVAALAGLCLASPAGAASRKDVLAACNNTPGCGYSKNKKNGDISGCSINAGKCFYCPNDGKRQCFGVGRQLPPPGKRPVIVGEPVITAK